MGTLKTEPRDKNPTNIFKIAADSDQKSGVTQLVIFIS
jgi:hypothetical protein